jgi:hypothetical protein
VRSYRFARCAQNGLILAAMLSPLLHQPAAAQWGRHFSAAVGPAIVVDDAPPHAGATARAAGSLWPGPRTMNLLADGYLTWLAPGSEDFTFIDGSFNQRLREIQFGVGLSALIAVSPERSVSPYLLAGGVYRRSDISGETTIRDQSGQVTQQVELDQTQDQVDILLGLGTAIRAGARRILLEVRAYGGTTIYLPITVGLTF